jgi:hypothetical protein
MPGFYDEVMSGSTVTNIVLGIVVLALLVYRQLSVRRLNESYRVTLIIAVIGVVEFVSFLNSHHGNRTEIVEAVLGSLAIAAVTGAIRAPTVKVWRDDASGQLLRQGTWLTAVLWVVSVAAHLGYDSLVGGKATGDVGDATILLYLAVTLVVQRLIMLARVDRRGSNIPEGDASGFAR